MGGQDTVLTDVAWIVNQVTAKSGIHEGLSARLWADTLLDALRSLHTPFVLALADGTLDRRAYHSYIAQDAIYLRGFICGYECAIRKNSASSKSTSHEELANLLAGAYEELASHQDKLDQWGVTIEDTKPNPATQAYVEFLVGIAEDPNTGVLDILVSMLPCARLYAFLGCELDRAISAAALIRAGAPPNIFHDWVKTYSSSRYLAFPALKESLVDALGDDVDAQRYGALQASCFGVQFEGQDTRHVQTEARSGRAKAG